MFINEFNPSFKVLGCPEYRPPPNMWLTKSKKGDDVTVGCSATGEKWSVKCHGNQWMGHVGECLYSEWKSTLNNVTLFYLIFEYFVQFLKLNNFYQGDVVDVGASKSKLPSIPFGESTSVHIFFYEKSCL